MKYAALFLSIILSCAAAQAAQVQTDVVAVSLNEAERRLASGTGDPDLIRELCGIRVVLGMVYDRERRDVLIVGRRGPAVRSAPPTLDDIVTCLRALVIRKKFPLVSLDVTPQTARTRRQAVRFEGVDPASRVAADLLAADVKLKRIGLGLIKTGLENLPSYFDLCVAAQRRGSLDLDLGSRFWFVVSEKGIAPTLNRAAGVWVARDTPLVVRTESVRSAKGRASEAVVDPLGERFSAAFSSRLRELAATHPELDRLYTIFTCCWLASGMEQLVPKEELAYWLDRYPIVRVPTPRDWPLLERRSENVALKVSGGIELRTIMLKLEHGEASGFRDAVLSSRPRDGAPLAWRVELGPWKGLRTARNAGRRAPDKPSRYPAFPGRKAAGYLMRSPLRRISVPALPRGGVRPVALPKFPSVSHLPYRPFRARANGVLLRETARLEGIDAKDIESIDIDPTTGSFGVTVAGKRVAMAHSDFRRFITAGWCTVFGVQPPGISIDPGGEDGKQVVRFIGNTAGYELARCLLDCDYYMKRAAIGRVRPRVPGFRSVDELAGRHKVGHLGAGRRFWFKPAGMVFVRSGNAIFFEAGRIELLTEKLLKNKRGVTDPVDRAFCEFWNTHYWEIAAAVENEIGGEKGRMFVELYEWAKDVALWTYLKESGVSLKWFLLKHRHLVMREAVEGTVPELRSPSRTLRGVLWTGGVNLRVRLDRTPKLRAGRDADRAIREFLSSSWTAQTRDTEHAPTLTLHRADAMGGGTSSTGVAFHTDIALRAKREPGLELTRLMGAGIDNGRFGRSRFGRGRFGRTGRLYLPSSIRHGRETIRAAKLTVRTEDGKDVEVDIEVPATLHITETLDGHTEHLRFDRKRYGHGAWVPEDAAKSRYKGVALLADGSVMVHEKNGLKQRFDAKLRLTHLVFSPEHWTQYVWNGNRIVAVRDSLGGLIGVEYDAANRIRSITHKRDRFDYAYHRDELAAVHRPTGESLYFIYTDKGTVDEVIRRKR
ncbi:MAG: DUF1598 domain-containing protein [Planctomycetota bacterium]|jgi:hypothetical protein